MDTGVPAWRAAVCLASVAGCAGIGLWQGLPTEVSGSSAGVALTASEVLSGWALQKRHVDLVLPAAQVVAGGAAADAAMEGGGDAEAPGAAAGQAAAQQAAHLRMGSLPTALTCALYNECLVRPPCFRALCLVLGFFEVLGF